LSIGEELKIEAYRQYQREAMEAGIGQVIHLSYRLEGAEVRRIRVHGPAKSSFYLFLQQIAESYDEWPSFKHRLSRSFKELLAFLPPDKYPKART